MSGKGIYCEGVAGLAQLDAEALQQMCADWDSLPSQLRVGGSLDGHLPSERVERKQHQITNMMFFVAIQLLALGAQPQRGKRSRELGHCPHDEGGAKSTVSRQSGEPPLKVVDFCCGGGHQSLPLAHMFPQVQFVLIDCKARSLDIARRRAQLVGLCNVEFLEARIECFNDPFDVGLALHACGCASDIALDKCLAAGAACVMAPCCVGKLRHATSTRSDTVGTDDSGIEYPRSGAVRDALDFGDYLQLARAADFGHAGYDDSVPSKTARPQAAQLRRRCKSVIEWDRNMRAAERGYAVWQMVMEPPWCTPKNDVLVGSPAVAAMGLCNVLGSRTK